MTQLHTTYAGEIDQSWGQFEEPLVAANQLGTVAVPSYLPRSQWLPFLFLLPIVVAALSFAMNGVRILTDTSFIILIMLCSACFVRELAVFPRRFGIGGLLAFGGTLIWFCYDYVDHWLGTSVNAMPFEPWVLAKSAFYHMVFVFLMVLGLYIKKGRWLQRVMQAVPEPADQRVYFLIVLVLFAIGLIPFLFSQENFFVTIYKSMFAGRSNFGTAFTAGRTGNLNYSWGGYVTQLADIGMMGSVLAGFHAVIVTRSLTQKIICWAIWGFWMAISFGTGTRGFVLFVGMPVMLLLFLKYNFIAAAAFRRLSVRAYVGSAALGLIFLVLTQIQGLYRNSGFFDVESSQVDTELRGNEMFTTTLVGMQLIPGNVGFFADRFPGEGMIRAIPEAIYWFVIGPMPRALWTNKPIDDLGPWYSQVVTGERRGAEGTTISGGAVGSWYFKFGPWGVIECALLYGWMMGSCERSLQTSNARPMALLFILAFATFMFRAFRDLWWHNLYPVIIGAVVMYVFVKTFNIFFGGANPDAGGDGTVQSA